MNYQLRSLIEWAKDIKGFVDLSDNDKVTKNNKFRIELIHFSRLHFYVVILEKISS
jgi:hypothetical protein